jgi:DNA-binding transcriptional MerR regulator
MDEDTTFLRVRDLVDKTGLPEPVVKKSLRTFGEFFTSTKQGRTRLYPPETADLLRQIADLEAMGTTPPSIRGILRGGGAEASAGGNPGSGMAGGSLGAAGEILTLGALQDIKNLQETIGELQGEITTLREKAADQEQKLIGHQQQIRLLRRELDEIKTDSLARKMEGRNTPIWRRLMPGKGGLER